MSPDDQDVKRVEEIFLALSLAEDDEPLPAPIVSFGDLVTHLARTKRLTDEQWTYVFSNHRLRADYWSLKANMRGQRLGAGPIAQLKAASDGAIDQRPFDGGRIDIKPSAVAQQFYIVITLENPAHPPLRLSVRSREGEFATAKLGPPNADGKIVLLKSLAASEDAMLIRLLRDPNTEGEFDA